MRKSIYYILSFVFVSSLLTSCNVVKNKSLKPVYINTDLVKNVSKSSAYFKIITNYLKNEHNVKGNIEQSIIINEVNDDVLENLDLNIKIFEVKLDYAWVDGIAVIKNKEVVGFLSGMTRDDLFMSDINNDGNYEIIFTGSLGSGLLYNLIQVMDTKDNKVYNITLFKENKRIKLVLDDADSKIYLYYVYNYLNEEQLSEEPLGNLQLKDNKLVVEGLKEDEDIKINNGVLIGHDK